MSKVYSTLGSGLVVALAFGTFASKGYISPYLVYGLLIVNLVAEIVSLCSRKNGQVRKILDPSTFYSYAFCFGSMSGILHASTEGEEKIL